MFFNCNFTVQSDHLDQAFLQMQPFLLLLKKATQCNLTVIQNEAFFSFKCRSSIQQLVKNRPKLKRKSKSYLYQSNGQRNDSKQIKMFLLQCSISAGEFSKTTFYGDLCRCRLGMIWFCKCLFSSLYSSTENIS